MMFLDGLRDIELFSVDEGGLFLNERTSYTLRGIRSRREPTELTRSLLSLALRLCERMAERALSARRDHEALESDAEPGTERGAEPAGGGEDAQPAEREERPPPKGKTGGTLAERTVVALHHHRV